ncbi:PcfJ domain-containing protein [Clostridium sp. AF32-12BH]|uniref:PcfJ domain-containing protein n=1 Tax=Clostridium sp. AF32-12BH TaxID=2292006 RepID=UPI001FAA9E4D|nr:PcfJ domain-containing protein [Clostridium sp. AF32-12BH]
MKVYKEKQYLIFDFEDGRNVKYDFATQLAIGIKGNYVKNLQGQLRGVSICKMCESCEDKNYASFLRFVDRHEHYITNVGTLLNRVPKYSRFEQIFSAGLNIHYYEGTSFMYSISTIPKSLIKLCRTYDIPLRNKLVLFYKENQDAHLIPFQLDFVSLSQQDIISIWLAHNQHYIRETMQYLYKSYFNMLVNDFGYNAKDLWMYLDRIKTYEAIEDMSFLIQELYDYANMMHQLSDKYDKYPRHFLTTHKIACRNYNRMKKEFSEEIFKKRITKQYECTFGDYIFIYPKSTQDIKQEACMQNNCVASYIDRVINGECHILFLRKKDRPSDSLVTIEVRDNHIVQARRRFNDPVTPEDQVAIDAFNKKFQKERKIA